MNDDHEEEFNVVQLATGNFFSFLRPDGVKKIRQTLLFGMIPHPLIHNQLESICKQRGVPIPRNYRIRRVSVRILSA